MNILLIRPRTTGDAGPPMGLLQLAAVLKPAGHRVQVLDIPPESSDFVRAAREFGPRLAGLSLLTPQVRRGREIASALRAALPGPLTLIAGGIHPTALPGPTLAALGLDAVVVGEGDLSLPELVRALETGRPLAEVAGLALPGPSGRPQFTAARPLVENLDDLPPPDREAVDFEHYLRPPGNIRGTLLARGTPVIIGRGCPFRCSFCSSHRIFGRRVRMRSAASVLAELDGLVERYRIDGVWFLDDTLFEDPAYLAALCEAMAARPWRLKWSCQAHSTRVRPDLLPLMRRAGCVQIEFGVESGSPAVLRRLRKGQSPDHVRTAFRAVRQAGIRTLANFMLGNPGETEADLARTFRLAREIRPDHVVVTFTTPLPGSELYDEAVREGWVDPDGDFGPEWTIRQIDRPVIPLGIAAAAVQAYRSRFDNAFFLRNHLAYLRDPAFVGHMLSFAVRHPALLADGLRRALKARRLSHLVERLWEGYSQP